jgi:histidine kinase
LLVVAISVVTTALMSRSLSGAFFEGHLEDMAAAAASSGEASRNAVMMDDLRLGFSSSFERSIWVAMLVSGAVALAAGGFATGRLLRPIYLIRRATRRMAGGAYSYQIPIPRETELAGLAEDVNALGSALHRVEERRVRLISEVAHELRTPLATIEGYMEGLLDGVFDPSDEIFAVAAQEASRLKRLANDLSALSAAEAGSIELKKSELDLGRVAVEAADRLRPQYEAQGVALLVVMETPLPVIGDFDRLVQVFINIIGNALTHTPADGEVVVTGVRQGTDAMVHVADTGQGMLPEQLTLIFERFYRVDRNRRGGTGIGLTIARRLVNLHDGDVTAVSAGLDMGSTFSVGIPLAKP